MMIAQPERGARKIQVFVDAHNLTVTFGRDCYNINDRLFDSLGDFAMTENVSETSGPENLNPRRILVVDDSRTDRARAGGLVQRMGDWEVHTAIHGKDALSVLERGPQFDLVLTDLLMPEMDGLELVQLVKQDYPLTPIILMTANGSEEIAIEALRCGAASYVPKRDLSANLESTIEQVLIASRTNRDQHRLSKYQTVWEAQFALENDPSLIPPLVGHFEEHLQRLEICEPAGLVLLGVALHEALTNAMFHGNLDVSSDLRDSEEARYYQLAEERRTQAPWSTRRVHVMARMSLDEAEFVIRDEGAGFDPSTLPDPTDPTNLEKVSGRGLLLIRTFMDHVEHNPTGNQITMSKRRWVKSKD